MRVQKLNICRTNRAERIQIPNFSLFLPVYSVLEGVEEVVESFSQSFSPLRLPAEGQDEKPSAESGLIVATKQQTQTEKQITPRHIQDSARHCTQRHAQKQRDGSKQV